MSIVKKMKRNLSKKIHRDIVHITPDEYSDKIDLKKIAIHIDSKENILEKTFKDEKLFFIYQKLIEQDYMLYWHHEGSSYFIKRNRVGEIWERPNLHSFCGLFYTITEPIESRMSEKEESNLVVIFSPVPNGKKVVSSNIADRTFQTYFPNIQRFLPKNTYILRIMDVNLTYGSLYFNTSNYPDMELDVQSLISSVISSLGIDRKRTVLYGVDSVGISALFHAIKGGYLSVSTNPTLSIEKMNHINGKKISSYFGNLDDDLFNIIEGDGNLFYNPEEHLVISTEEKREEVIKLEKFSRLQFMKDKYEEEDISKNATIEQIKFINNQIML